MFQLNSRQNSFVEQFVSRSTQKTLLVAPTGAGKSVTALAASRRLIDAGAIDSVLVISDGIVIRDQWQMVASRFGIDLRTSLKQYSQGNGVAITSQLAESTDLIDVAAKARRWLVVAEDWYDQGATIAIVDRMLRASSRNRALMISSTTKVGDSYDAKFSFAAETFLSPEIICAPATQIRVVQCSPSIAILQRLRGKGATIDDLNWREFETVVAALLEEDGYNVELMQGTKDGGVDVIAVKDLGPNGYFKALWQAKKQRVSSKVGISVVRELADTRREFGASKGIIVTSSFLTRGALERVDRDKYLLGKVDRNELQAWIDRTLLHHVGS